MARQVAHEVKNPLTPIAISVADLKRSYEQRPPGLPADPRPGGAHDRRGGRVAQAAAAGVLASSAACRRRGSQPCGVGELFADLATLYGARGRGRPARVRAAGRRRRARRRPRPAAAGAGQPDPERRSRRRTPRAASRVTRRGAATARVEIAVADDGPGLDAEQRAQLFVPDFTTKPHGSGLGLTIVERIVNDHGGTIAVESRARAAARRSGSGCRCARREEPEHADAADRRRRGQHPHAACRARSGARATRWTSPTLAARRAPRLREAYDFVLLDVRLPGRQRARPAGRDRGRARPRPW